MRKVNIIGKVGSCWTIEDPGWKVYDVTEISSGVELADVQAFGLSLSLDDEMTATLVRLNYKELDSDGQPTEFQEVVQVLTVDLQTV